MGKKPQKHTWGEAKHLCRLNRFDVEMAKQLGFRPDSLVRARPSPQQKWKLPVKYWIRELYEKRFGKVLGQKPEPQHPPEPALVVYWDGQYNESEDWSYVTVWDEDERLRVEQGDRGDGRGSEITDDDVPF